MSIEGFIYLPLVGLLQHTAVGPLNVLHDILVSYFMIISIDVFVFILLYVYIEY